MNDLQEDEDDYSFTLDTDDRINTIRERSVEINVGGVSLNLLVDSGASCNVIGDNLWTLCKQKGIRCKSYKSNRKIYPYGHNKALAISGEFDCNVKMGGILWL